MDDRLHLRDGVPAPMRSGHEARARAAHDPAGVLLATGVRAFGVLTAAATAVVHQAHVLAVRRGQLLEALAMFRDHALASGADFLVGGGARLAEVQVIGQDVLDQQADGLAAAKRTFLEAIHQVSVEQPDRELLPPWFGGLGLFGHGASI